MSEVDPGRVVADLRQLERLTGDEQLDCQDALDVLERFGGEAGHAPAVVARLRRGASGADDAIQLIPPREMTLEFALEFIEDDELVEVTPKSIRLRKKILNDQERKVAAKKPAAV